LGRLTAYGRRMKIILIIIVIAVLAYLAVMFMRKR
jgi:hypothetical protein